MRAAWKRLPKKYKAAISGLSIAVVVLIGIVAWPYIFPASSAGGNTTRFTEIKTVRAPINGLDLDADLFNGKLYGCPNGEDATDGANFDVLWNGQLSDLDYSDFNVDDYGECPYYLGYKANAVLGENFPNDFLGQRDMGYRMALVDPEDAATLTGLVTYTKPSAGLSEMGVFTNGTAIGATGATTIKALANFTVTAYLTNSTQWDAAFVSYFDILNETVIYPNTVVTIAGGAVPNLTDLKASNTFSSVKGTAQSIVFNWESIGITPVVSHYTWGAGSTSMTIVAGFTGIVQYMGVTAV